MTLARSAAEEEALRTSLSVLAGSGLPVFVADGGSSERFLAFLATVRGVTRVAPTAPGLVGQITALLRAARSAGARMIFYTEPDKTWFFAERLAGFLERARASAAPLVIAGRDEASFATFPDTQRFTETIANRVVASCTSRQGDYFYGPFLVRADAVDYLQSLNSPVGWGWRPFLFTLAHRRHLATLLVAGDFQCPPEQREEHEGDRVHRLRQLAQNVDGVAQAMAADIAPTSWLSSPSTSG